MTRHDYSLDADLLLEEVYDLDTKDELETFINDGRMRLPTRYDISKFYERSNEPTWTDRNGNYLYEMGEWVDKENPLDFSKDFDWQITYNFPETRHPNITTSGAEYGGANVTYRRLYLILCEHFNGGKFFIDDYFDTVYPHTVKPEVDARLEAVRGELVDIAESYLEGAKVTKKGQFDKRYKINQGIQTRMSEYESFASAWEESEGEELARLIKDDIISCMLSGQLQTEVGIPDNSERTKKRRKQAGLSEAPSFVAIGNLIDSLQLYVKIEGNKQWQTKQGILV